MAKSSFKIVSSFPEAMSLCGQVCLRRLDWVLRHIFILMTVQETKFIDLVRKTCGVFFKFIYFFTSVCSIGQVHLGQAEVEGEVRKKHACFYITDCSLLHEANSLASTRVCNLGWSPFQHKNCCRGLQALRSIDCFLAHCLYYIFQLIICNAFRLVRLKH